LSLSEIYLPLQNLYSSAATLIRGFQFMRLLQNKEINSLNDIVAVILWQIRPGKTRKVDELPLQGFFFFHLWFLSVFAYKFHLIPAIFLCFLHDRFGARFRSASPCQWMRYGMPSQSQLSRLHRKQLHLGLQHNCHSQTCNNLV
jgi:hypothetical protein